jgi:voltage-gated potassium channel Kch
LREQRRKYMHFRSLVKWILSGVAIVLGFIGFGGMVALKSLLHLHDIGQGWQSVTDAFYKTLGLLTLRLPRQLEETGVPWQINWARFLLPALGIWLSIEAYWRLARQRMHFFSLFRISDHVIVVGPGARAHKITQQCRASEDARHVIYISEHEDQAVLADLHALGVFTLHGSPIEPDTYIRAKLKRARAVIVAGEGGMENIPACNTIRDVAREGRASNLAALSLIVAIDSPEMAALLDASFHEIRDYRIEYRLLDPADNVAQVLVKRLLPLLGSPNGAEAIVMIGWGGPAPAIFRRLVRNSAPGFGIIVIDRNAEVTKGALLASAPALSELSGLRFIATEASPALLASAAVTEVLTTLRIGAFIISGDNDETNFRIAIQLRRFARTHGLWTPPIYVRQQGSGAAFYALKLVEGEAIDVSRLHHFGSLEEQFGAQGVLRGRDETMAQAVHQDYLAHSPIGSEPNCAPWEELLETFRSASRAQAEHIDVKLANAGCRLVPGGSTASFAFTSEEVERLAVLEHWRWCVDRWLDGWLYAPEKKVDSLKHNLLVPYEQLTESVKDYDRAAVRNVPNLVAIGKSTIQREQCIVVDAEQVDEPGTEEKVAADAEAVRRAGMFPIVVLRLASKHGLELARDFQQRGLAVRLVLNGAVTALLAALPRQDLIRGLDAADDVIGPLPPSSTAPTDPPETPDTTITEPPLVGKAAAIS